MYDNRSLYCVDGIVYVLSINCSSTRKIESNQYSDHKGTSIAVHRDFSSSQYSKGSKGSPKNEFAIFSAEAPV